MSKKNNITLFFLILSLLFYSNTIIAQCNDTLIKQAILESGPDAVFLKEFKVKFKKGKTNRPAKVAKYSVFLKDSTTYRFNVVNAKEFEGKAILQLFRKGKILGSTYNMENFTYQNGFDFECKFTDTYQIYMSFIEGKSGCAAGILSMVVNDSTLFDESNTPDVLYAGVENDLFIAYTEEPGCTVHVLTDQGTISGHSGKYSILPNYSGSLVITAQTIDSLGNVKEEITKTFKVTELPNPVININGNTGGLIHKSEILNAKELSLTVYNIPKLKPYKILGFTISDKYLDPTGKNSDGKSFTYQQIEFINKLTSGSHLYITNIKILRPDNKTIELKPVGYIIQ